MFYRTGYNTILRLLNNETSPRPRERIFEILHSNIKVQLENCDESGATPLIIAMLMDDLELMKLLISAGANVNVVDKVMGSPLHIASFINDIDMVEMLLKAGAEPNIRNLESYIPLHYAVAYASLDLINILIENGADPNLTGKYNFNAFEYGNLVNEILSLGQD